MYVSVFLLLGHLYLSLIHPTTRHSLNAITRGWVKEDWALQHHRKWTQELQRLRPDQIEESRVVSPGSTSKPP
jgi:cytochrome b subunit of formate dehydrogenase